MGNDASRLQGGYDPIAELETLNFLDLTTDQVRANPPSFSFSEWEAHVRGMEVNQTTVNIFLRSLFTFILEEDEYQLPDPINGHIYYDTACKVFAFMIRHVPLELLRIGFDTACQFMQNCEYNLFEYAESMIQNDDVQGIQKLNQLFSREDWLDQKEKLQRKIWRYAVSKEMLEVINLHANYHFPTTLDRWWLPPDWITADKLKVGMKNLVKKDPRTNAFRPLAMLEYFYAAKFETDTDAWKDRTVPPLAAELDPPLAAELVQEYIGRFKRTWLHALFDASIHEGNVMAVQFLLHKCRAKSWEEMGDIILRVLVPMQERHVEANQQILMDVLNFSDRPEWTTINTLQRFGMDGKVDLVYSILYALLVPPIHRNWMVGLADIAMIQLIVWNQPLIHQKAAAPYSALTSNNIPLFYQKVQKCYQDLLQELQGKDEEGIRVFHLNHVANLIQNPQHTYGHRYPTKQRRIENKPATVSHACNEAWAIYYLYHHVHGKKLVHAQHWDFSYALHEWMLRNDMRELYLRADEVVLDSDSEDDMRERLGLTGSLQHSSAYDVD
jgi:hypothetical protein